MKVLWLGAGASMSAGYPSAAELIPALTDFVGVGTDVATAEAWGRFCNYRNTAEGVLRTVLHSPNPEVVLTVPDLLAAALDADNEDIEADTMRMVQRVRSVLDLDEAEIEQAAKQYEERYNSPSRTPLQQARYASRDFKTVLDAYLAVKHYTDGLEANKSTRDCLRRELEWLADGDVVITTNWDTSAERTLQEDLRWTPTDGYGFHVSLIEGHRARSLGERNALPEWVPIESRVRVLKLHGSFGWRISDRYGPRVSEQGHVWLDYDQFLSAFPFACGGQIAVARDARTPEFYDPSEHVAYVVPSYLKQLTGASLQRVWFTATETLRIATHIKIIGASLPGADVAIRALLNPLRFFSKEGSTHVSVHDPDKGTLARWKVFLGDSVETVCRKAGASIPEARPIAVDPVSQQSPA